MDDYFKTTLKENAEEHLKKTIDSLNKIIAERKEKNHALRTHFRGVDRADLFAEQRILAHHEERQEDLQALLPSPYFSYLEFTPLHGESKKIYIGKFSFLEEQIYSWITPIASLRFEQPGLAHYTKPDATTQKGTLAQKDQYLITQGKILFYATETITTPHTLIYQEHFTTRTKEFALPEIVAQMEKAQDQVIRAHFKGPLIIAGPAGSGKTTLALHRVAYLTQSPDTREHFSPDSIIVWVQDAGTKAYFSRLLPELGIKGVRITTFAEWAMHILNLTEEAYVVRYGENETERDRYEFQKLTALRHFSPLGSTSKLFPLLEKIYTPYFDETTRALFKKQMKQHLIDRFDLTLGLQNYLTAHGTLHERRDYYRELKNGTYKKASAPFPAQYNLAVIDEFQNYLPEQRALLQGCLNPKLNAAIYVGDAQQQIYLGTSHQLSTEHHTIPPDRQVRLHKVYRSTRPIVEFIHSLGFKIEIPPDLKDGPAVIEKIFTDFNDQTTYLKNLQTNNPGTTIGVLSFDKEVLKTLPAEFEKNPRLHFLTIPEAQGVEFDIVCVVGISSTLYSSANNIPEIKEEKKKILQDLLYVALTRAITELHVLGSTPLHSFAAQLFTTH